MALSPQRWQQIESLFQSAREHAPAERESFLAEACADDADLLKEVASLLREASSGQLDKPLMEAAASLLSNSSSWEPGAKIGPYQIVSRLGEGGMGVVYRALDTRLDRSVAIKTTSREFSGRFQQEARAIAALNHPNICTLHDVGPDYLVMELVDGKPLSCPQPLDAAIRYAIQIADALDSAHRRGITHRDLKPANILVTKSGLKLLDFGLAKFTQPQTDPDATQVMGETQPGMILGTPQYMSPEQVEAKEADARSDIFSFGAILYEMISGSKAFAGTNAATVMSAVMRETPPSIEPPALNRIIKRCLEKDPDDRFQNARDVKHALEDLQPETPAKSPVVSASRWLWITSAACLLLGAISGSLWMRRPIAPTMPVKLEVVAPSDSRFAPIINAGGSAISPDGRILAFVINANGTTQLYVRPLDSLTGRTLPGTENAGRPFWSPDSKSLAFVADGKLKRIDLAGGIPNTLCDALLPRGGAWNEEGQIVFASQGVGLQRIPASGGTPSPVTILPEDGGTRHYYPQFLPGGKTILYLILSTTAAKSGIYIHDLDEINKSKSDTLLFPTNTRALYDSNSGNLLYIQGTGTLMAKRMELNPPRLLGDPVTIAENVLLSSGNRYAEVSTSANGVLFYGQGAPQQFQFAWYDRAGQRLETIGSPSGEGRFSFRLSPDKRLISYVSGTTPDVWTTDFARSTKKRVTFGGGDFPQWSPDGMHLYYLNKGGIYKKAANGSGEEEFLLKAGLSDSLWGVSTDGKWLLFGHEDIMILPLTGEHKPAVYLQTKHVESGAVFSSDGRWVAYSSNETGHFEVYIQGFPERRGKWVISTDGGISPRWRSDGKELYWSAPDGTVMAASVDLQQDGVQSGPTQKLFRVSMNSRGHVATKDGRRFLMQEAFSSPQEYPMVVVQNWAARLGGR